MVWVGYPVSEQIRITEIFSLFEVHYNNGYAFLGEAHNFWECVYIRRGRARVSGDGRVYELSSGSIIFHKPMEFHKFTIQEEAGADLLIFSYQAEGPLGACLGGKVFELTASQQRLLEEMVSFLRERAGAGRLEYETYLRPFSTDPIYSQQVAMYLQQLMLSIARKGAVSAESLAPDALLFRKAVDYLNSNIHRQPDLPEIARFCSVSLSGIKRIFEKYAGIGIHKYLLKLKMKAAAELLSGGESVSAVGERLGFKSQSYFSRAFQRETGLAPSDLKP